MRLIWLLILQATAKTLTELPVIAEGELSSNKKKDVIFTHKTKNHLRRDDGSLLDASDVRSDEALLKKRHNVDDLASHFVQPSISFNRQELGSMDVAAHSTQFASFGSSILAAFSLTLITEVGDRTFFVAALLAAQYNKWQVWVGGVGALWTQTILCSMFGAFLHGWQFKSSWMSWPIDDYFAGALLITFGILHIREGLTPSIDDLEPDKNSLELSPSTTLLEAPSGRKTPSDRRRASTVSIRNIEQAREQINTNTLAKNQNSIMIHAFWLVMAAEIGDRSMFSTVALAAAQNPWGVALGAALGHALVTAAAVTCAALLSQFLNERITSVLGGLLFVAFGILSLIEGLVRQAIL